MVGKTKKFDACVLRVASGECVVAEWHQLVLSHEKSKLQVGSSVGIRPSKNKREKIVRGKILVIGSIRLCEQQMKIFNGKKKKKDIEEAKEEDDEDEEENEEEEEVGNSRTKSSSALNDEESSESDDDNLKIIEEESCGVVEPKSNSTQQIRLGQEKNKKQAIKSKETISKNNDTEPTSNRESSKRGLPDAETAPPPPKRPMVSLARLQELQGENATLKKQNEKFRTEWMLMIIVELSKISSTKTTGLQIGKEVTYVTSTRDRGRGVILSIGTEEECKELFRILENTQNNQKDNNVTATPINDGDEDSEEEDQDEEVRDEVDDDEGSGGVDDEGEDRDEIDEAGEDECNDQSSVSNPIVPEKQANVSTRNNNKTITATTNNLVTARSSSNNENTPAPLANKRLSNDENLPPSKKSKYEENDKYLRSRLYALQEENKKLKLKIEEMEKQWMPRPDSATIDYFAKIVSICRDEKDYEDTKGDRIMKIMEILAMSEDELNECIDERSLRNTCRKLVRVVFKEQLADPTIHFHDILSQKDKVAAIRDFGRLMHPLESGRYTNGEINNAMGSDFYQRDRMIKQNVNSTKVINNDQETADESE